MGLPRSEKDEVHERDEVGWWLAGRLIFVSREGLRMRDGGLRVVGFDWMVKCWIYTVVRGVC